MTKQKYVYWTNDEAWLGYLEEFQIIGRKEKARTTSNNILSIFTKNSPAVPSRTFAGCQSLTSREGGRPRKKLEGLGCVFIRHGGKHDWYQNLRLKFLNPCRGIARSKSRLQSILSRCSAIVMPDVSRHSTP